MPWQRKKTQSRKPFHLQRKKIRNKFFKAQDLYTENLQNVSERN